MTQTEGKTPTLFVSYDIGNHYVKVQITRDKTKTKIIESGIVFSTDSQKLDTTDRDTFTCKHGSKVWRGRSWYSSLNGYRPFDLMDSELCFGDTPKGFLSFPLLTLAIWDELQNGDVVAVNGTVQNIHTNRPLIIEELTGVHTVTKDNELKRFEFLNPQILTEGVGAIMQQTPKKGDMTMLLDLGGDTVILSFFDGLKLRGDIYPVPGIGTNLLIKWCIGAAEVSEALGRQPYNDAEALQILRGESIKNVRGEPADFAHALECLTLKWILEIKRAVINRSAYLVRNCNKKLATGGGTLIKGVGNALNGQGISIIKDGQLANVKGIHKRLLSQWGINTIKPASNKSPKPTATKKNSKVTEKEAAEVSTNG